MFGRKLVYLLGFVMFAAMALVGGLSQSLGFLIAVKVVQGLASAGIQANSMALITEVFPDRERGKAMGMYMAIIGTGAVSGPMVGGYPRLKFRLALNLLHGAVGRNPVHDMCGAGAERQDRRAGKSPEIKELSTG